MAKAAKRGLFHKKTLARKISRLASQANAAGKKAK
jgi:ribosomal protein S20